MSHSISSITLFDESNFLKSQEDETSYPSLSLYKSTQQLVREERELKDFEKTVELVKKKNTSKSKTIKQAREAKGITREQLARIINVKKSVIADYEEGRIEPKGAIWSKLKRVLGI